MDNFSKWIGAPRDAVSEILDVFSDRELHQMDDLKVTASENRFDIELSAHNLRILRNCVFEACNRIALYEFKLRMVVELAEALSMLRVMDNALE